MDTLLFYMKLVWNNLRTVFIGSSLYAAGAIGGIGASSIFFFSNVEEDRMQTWLHLVIPIAGVSGSVILGGYLLLRLMVQRTTAEHEKREAQREKEELETVLRGDAPEKSIGGGRTWFQKSEQTLLPHEEKKVPFLERVPRLSLPWKRKDEEE